MESNRLDLLLLSFLLLVFSSCSIGQWAKLSEITFNFTTCGTQGKNGPTHQTCYNEYDSTDSLLATMLINISEQQGFNGGQGFQFPRSGTYNITVAGASGGRGLCNPKTSKGAILRTQLNIVKGINDTVLVLVGQKGRGPCDSNSNHFLCTSPPTNLTEATQCLNQWMNVSNSIQYQDRLGGGGGGGGSMIWATNSTGHFNASVLPMMAAGGGGGTSLQAEYNAIKGMFFGRNVATFQRPNETNEEFYDRWINARPSYIDDFNNGTDFAGFVGNRPAVEGLGSSIVSGAGAGWFFTGITFTEIDGKPLSRSTNFAEGGLDCIVGFGFEETGLPFQSIIGGFGGGGGGCSEGGGGGGFGGGIVLDDGPDIPGGGGYSLITINNGEKITSVSDGMNEGDGYVEIIQSNCGCTNGCVVDRQNLQYQCTCIPPATVSPTGTDCITTTSREDLVQDNQVLPTQSVTISSVTVSFSLIRFSSFIKLYGATITFTITELGDRGGGGVVKRDVDIMESEEEIICAIIWLNENSVPVLISDSSNGTLRLITNQTNGKLSDGVFLLEAGILVSAGVIMGNANCTIDNFTLAYSTEPEDSSTSTINLQSIINNYENIFQGIVSQIFPSPVPPLSSSTPSLIPSLISTLSSITSSVSSSSTTSITTTPTVSMTTMIPSLTPIDSQMIIIYSASAGGGALLIMICLVLIIVITACAIRRKRSTSLRRVYQIHEKNYDKGEMKAIGINDQQHPELQKLRYKLASLKTNPNYGQPMIRGIADDEIDMGEKIVIKNSNVSTSVDMGSVEEGYTALSFTDNKQADENHIIEARPPAQPHRVRSRSRRKTFTLKPKFGVMSPSVSFYEYNRQREENDWEHDRTQLTYLREIGEGQFGKVLLMKAKNIAGYKGKLPVAVKTLTSIEDEDVTKFLEEIELMKKFAHPHIVSLLGVSSQSSEGAPLMILEYMPYGDLQSFLTKHKPKQGEQTIIGIYHQIRFAGDIASAMSFLESNKYVHRDVAARNCLVGPNLEVKVADFGMARVVQEKDYYRIAGRAVLPVRWMAPESLLYGLFTSASDVWAYGVLLWEIANYGSIPLETYNAQDIVEMAQQNSLYHPWPQDYLEELMQIKDECHHYEAEKRPRFGDIVKLLPNSHSN